MSYIMLRSSAFERSTCPYFSKMEEHHQHESIAKFWCLVILRNAAFGQFCLQFIHLNVRQLFKEENFFGCYLILNIGSGSSGSQKCSDNIVMYQKQHSKLQGLVQPMKCNSWRPCQINSQQRVSSASCDTIDPGAPLKAQGSHSSAVSDLLYLE